MCIYVVVQELTQDDEIYVGPCGVKGAATGQDLIVVVVGMDA